MQEGQRIRDYLLEEKIGEGGMGEVWRAEHTILHRKVAIKAMARHVETDPEFGQRFLQEAQSQARLNHPRIVHVSDFFAEDGQYFLVMPLLSGKNLADRLHDVQGPLSVGEALGIARDVLDALDYAHQQGVIHRDVKPSNILLDQEDHASLTDFGIALSLGRQRVTQATTSLGTPHYMSPEQIRSPRTVDHRTDVYSFGCVLYEMLTGRPPFAEAADSDDTDFALKEAHVYRVPEPLRTRNPQIPAWLDAVVLRALAKNPDERFSGCGEFRRTLEAPPAAAQPIAPAPAPVRAVRKTGEAPAGKRLPVALIVGIAVAVAVLAALVLFATRERWGSEEPAVEESATGTATTEPMDPNVEVIEAGNAKLGRPGTNEADEPVTTDLEATAATDAGTDQRTDQGTVEPVPVEIDIRPARPEPETTEPVTTDLEVHGGVNPPSVMAPNTVEPLGTDIAPPP
ncbi:MAG TPA: serine/threonine-protein kinase [Thermoanaerobaculia bacterium]|nr:serine/threonine-protein kinase [Thermoanaerobaculia bacterium]